MRAIGLACLTLLLLPACTTLPGYQGGPHPRSTQYTYPGRAWNPDSGMAHSPIARPAEPTEGGTFVFGFVYWDGSTGTSQERWDSFDACERERDAEAARVAERVQIGGRPIMTVKCFRAHESGVQQTR